LDLYLLRDQRLEGLITLRLMVLNGRATKRGTLAAYSTGPKLTASGIRWLAIGFGRSCSPFPKENLSIAWPQLLGVQAPSHEVILCWFDFLEKDRIFQKQIEGC